MRNLSISIHSILHDEKINAYSVAFEMPKLDYLSIIDAIIKNNELQRKRIKRASTVYDLMKQDLKAGCLLPPIVLSLDKGLGGEENILDILENQDKEKIAHYINQNAKHIKILDGLQRTNILQDIGREPTGHLDNKFYQKNLRFEMYIGISRYGILYRMLTLNTGQTQMSLRHQIEILYSDLYNVVERDIVLIREKDAYMVDLGRYNFNDMIEGMVSYIEGSELTIDRFDILDYIENLEKLSKNIEQEDIFVQFVEAYHSLIQHITTIFKDASFNKESLSEDEDKLLGDKKPFGKDMMNILTSSQAITGFGAAISQKSIKSIKEIIPNIRLESNATKALNLFIVRLAEVGSSARRISDTQRNFFKLFFTALFNEGEANFQFENAINRAFRIISNDKN